MKRKDFILAALVSVLIFRSSVAFSQNTVASSENGLTYQLSASSFVYAPEDQVDISYSIHNIENHGIAISFPDSRLQLVKFLVGKPEQMMLLQRIEIFHPAVELKIISRNERIVNTASVALTTLDSLNISDGDTLFVQTSPSVRTFDVGIPGPSHPHFRFDHFASFLNSFGTQRGDENYTTACDFDNDNIVDLRDWLIWVTRQPDTRTISDAAILSLQIFIRKQTADMNRDGLIDQEDFNIFFSKIGSRFGDSGYSIFADLTGDGVIGFSDFTEFVVLYRKSE